VWNNRAVRKSPGARPSEWLVWLLPFLIWGHFQVIEADLPFHARVGEEILRTGRVLTTDFWSWPDAGVPWFNHEWLSTVAIHAFARAGSDYALVPTFRALLIALVFGLASSLLVLRARSRESRWLQAASLLPALFCATWLQMRPELFAFVFWFLLLRVWARRLDAGEPAASADRRLLLSFLILLGWANFHSGTLPFGLLLSCAALFFDPAIGPRAGLRLWKWAVLFSSTWLLTPIGWNSIHVAFSTLAGPRATGNPDLEPLSFRFFSPDYGFLSGWIWVLWIGAAAYFGVRATAGAANRFEGTPWASKHFVPSVAFTIFAVALVRARAMPYLLFFLLPVIGAGIDEAIERLRARRGLNGTRLVLLSALLMAAWVPMMGLHVSRAFSASLGFGVSAPHFPVQSARFLNQAKPLGPLYNETDFGGYLIDQVRDLKVADATSGDTRRIYSRELEEARADLARRFPAFVEKQGFNTAVLRRFEPEPDGKGGVVFRLDQLFDPSRWALVFFDNAAMVLVRRIPAHEELIRRFEYRLLPRMLPDEGASRGSRDGVFAQAFAAETRRCLETDPDNFWCLLSQAAFLDSSGNAAGAAVLLARARDHRPLRTRIELP
jgi:hypothetical protein